MNNSNFSGDIIPTNISNNGHNLMTIPKDSTELTAVSRETTPATSSALISFAPQPHEIFQPTTPTEFLPSIDRWVSWCGILMVASLGAAIALSAILKYKVTVQAPAAIRPVGELRVVQSTIEGSVLSISVQENQTVQKGDRIATVKDLRLESKLQTKRNQLAGDIQKSKQQINAIDAQIKAIDRQGIAEIEQGNRSIAAIQADLSRAERDYRDKQITSTAQVAEAQANWRTAQKEQQAAEAELKVADANLKSIQAGYQSAFARSQRYQEAATAGAISTNQLEEAKLAAEQQAQSIAAQTATIFKQKQIIAQIAETVVAAAAKINRTQTALNPSRAESAMIVQKIARERATGTAAIARLQQERHKLLQQRVEVLNQITTHDREIAQIATELKPTAILAPIAGKIQELNLRNNLQVVHPGDRIAHIIPTTNLKIKAAVAIVDIDKVKIGQIVQMRVSACPHTDYGVASGRVTEVAADAKSSDKNISNNPQQQLQTAANNSYEVTIKPDRLTLDRGSQKCQIRSGMDGRVDIISEEETVLLLILRKARLLVNSNP